MPVGNRLFLQIHISPVRPNIFQKKAVIGNRKLP